MQSAELPRLKIILIASSLVSLVLLMSAASEEHFSGEWRDHQKGYRSALIARAKNDAQVAAAEAMAINYRQIFLPQLDRIDRCTTCHIGIDDPAMADAEQPLRAHSGTVLQTHPVEKFGCTVCHDGQGRAITRDDAHGEVEHWAATLLRGRRVYTSCSRCHTDEDLYDESLLDSVASNASDTKQPAEADTSSNGNLSNGNLGNGGAQAIERGRQIVSEFGCLGCHKYNGRGGKLGPDLTLVGDKGAHDFDFTHVQGEHVPAQWLMEHFKAPDRVSPDSLMPAVPLADDQLQDLTLYMLSLHRKALPTEYAPRGRGVKVPVGSGEELYMRYCSACHGRDGQGVEKPKPELKVPSLANPDTLSVASDDFLRAIIRHGRNETAMIAWGDPMVGGLSANEIDRIVSFIRSWQSPGPELHTLSASRGDAKLGGETFARNCAACHGEEGGGGIGTALNSGSFLRVAPDSLLAHTLVDGRSNTAMPSWRVFDAEQINNLLAHLRSWQKTNWDTQTVVALLSDSVQDASEQSAGTASREKLIELGKTAYAADCSQCHGVSGEGGLGSILNSQEYLSVASESYLLEAIRLGRSGTSMSSYRQLPSETVAGLVAFLKSWQTVPDKKLDPSRKRVGNWRVGEVMYQRLCLECHGSQGRGGTSIRLASPELAESATDAMLYEWIADGVSPSPELVDVETTHTMPAFLNSSDTEFQYSQHHLDDLVAYLREIQQTDSTIIPWRTVVGDRQAGKQLYAERCANCHADTGVGAIGASLSNPGFLAAAGDDFIVGSVVLGRDSTEMLPAGPSVEGGAGMTEQQVRDLTAYIRSWQTDPPVSGVPARYLVASYDDDPFVDMSVDNGRELFAANCAVCHGEDGRGTRDVGSLADCSSCHAGQEGFSKDRWEDADLVLHFGPRLNNLQFLTAATDGFLQATIVRGRHETAMRSFGFDEHGRENLDSDSIKDIVIYMRAWQLLNAH